MPRSRQRMVRLAILLPPLLFLTVFGYWRFLGSDAFQALVERILERALAGEVTIGSHEVESLAFKRIRLSDLSVEFNSLGAPSGVRFDAREATASASILLGVGPLEEVVMRDAEASFKGPASGIARLDLLARPRRAARVGRIRIEGMAVSFAAGGRTFRVGDMGWTFDFSGGTLRLSADVDRLRIEGGHSKGLKEEAPGISFDVEVSGPTSFAEATEADRSLGEGGPKVVLRELKVEGRSGWRAQGEMEADLARATPEFSGRIDLWDLPVSRVYTPRPG
ncbi:MAG: AsmA family protein, partial [Planctomycetota bacterium]